MIGNMIKKIRISKNISLTDLATLANIDKGHLSHIENGTRNPSHSALKNICKALEIPYQQLMYSYDKTLNDSQLDYGIVNHIPYNKVLAVDKINSIIDIPSNLPSCALAVKMNDDSMEPSILKKSFAYIEFNVPLNNNDIGIFNIDNKVLIRRFILSNGKIILKPDNKNYEEIIVDDEYDDFYIIGKVLNEDLD